MDLQTINFQEKVKEFQLASGQPVSDVPYTLTPDEFDFRDTLFREEYREFLEAVVDEDRVEMMDALCDMKYVTDGVANMTNTIVDDLYFQSKYVCKKNNRLLTHLMEQLQECECDDVIDINKYIYEMSGALGFTLENFKTALDRVHASNMSKFCYDIKTAERTQEFYAKQGIDTYVEPRNKMTVVYRKGDGKVLKSIEYHPVQLQDLV